MRLGTPALLEKPLFACSKSARFQGQTSEPPLPHTETDTGSDVVGFTHHADGTQTPITRKELDEKIKQDTERQKEQNRRFYLGVSTFSSSGIAAVAIGAAVGMGALTPWALVAIPVLAVAAIYQGVKLSRQLNESFQNLQHLT